MPPLGREQARRNAEGLSEVSNVDPVLLVHVLHPWILGLVLPQALICDVIRAIASLDAVFRHGPLP